MSAGRDPLAGLPPGAFGWARLGLVILGTLVLVPAHLLLTAISPRRRHVMPLRFHRLVCRGLGVRRTVRGAPPSGGGLIVANHVSWLDIPVIGAEMPLSFVAKAEVERWPVIGFLSTLQRTVFIDRKRRQATASVAAEMGSRLRAGELVVLFGEGTTGDGTRILPIRSSLLGAAHEALSGGGGGEVTVYPLTVTYTGVHGMAGGRALRSLLAWHGDTSLGPNLRTVLAFGAVDAELRWGEPIAMGAATSRKQAARLAEAAIRSGRRDSLRGIADHTAGTAPALAQAAVPTPDDPGYGSAQETAPR